MYARRRRGCGRQVVYTAIRERYQQAAAPLVRTLPKSSLSECSPLPFSGVRRRNPSSQYRSLRTISRAFPLLPDASEKIKNRQETRKIRETIGARFRKAETMDLKKHIEQHTTNPVAAEYKEAKAKLKALQGLVRIPGVNYIHLYKFYIKMASKHPETTKEDRLRRVILGVVHYDGPKEDLLQCRYLKVFPSKQS